LAARDLVRELWWIRRLQYGSGDEMRQAARHLADLKSARAAPHVIRAAAREDDTALLYGTLRAIGEAAYPEVFRAYPGFTDAERRLARAALSFLPTPRGFAPVLAGVLEEDRFPELRNVLVQALGSCEEGKGVLAVLARIAAAPDARLRLASIQALRLVHADPGATVPLLITALRDPQAEVREEAAFALGLWESAGRAATNPLLSLAADPDESVRSAASVALRRITGGDTASGPPTGEPKG